MESFSLFELNEYIRRVVALNFQEPLWVHGEISQIRNSRGNYYLEIIQKKKDSDEVVAQSSAALWYKSYMFLKKKLGAGLDSLLQDGIEVKLKVNLDFHERYGFKLIIEDIDPNFTLGQVELNRQKNIQQLKQQGLYDLNKRVSAPVVFQRIACISSESAAGYIDFMTQLEQNAYSYDFEVALYNSSVQGRNLELDFLAAFETISENVEEYDCVVIIRGGGSKLDLSGFDNYNVAAAIAQCNLPVITGIGHEIDETVSDMVSYEALKTPTAVADFLIDSCATLEGELMQLSDALKEEAMDRIRYEDLRITQIEKRIQMAPATVLERAKYTRQTLLQLLERNLHTCLQNENVFLAKAETLLEVMDPKKTLARGYAMIKQSKNIITSVKNIDSSNNITISLNDGDIDTKIIQINPT